MSFINKMVHGTIFKTFTEIKILKILFQYIILILFLAALD